MVFGGGDKISFCCAAIIVVIILLIVWWVRKKNDTTTTERAQGAAWKYSTDLSRRLPIQDGGFLEAEAKENTNFVRGGTTFFPKSVDRRPSGPRVVNPTIPRPPPAMETPGMGNMELPPSSVDPGLSPDAAPGEFERMW